MQIPPQPCMLVATAKDTTQGQGRGNNALLQSPACSRNNDAHARINTVLGGKRYNLSFQVQGGRGEGVFVQRKRREGGLPHSQQHGCRNNHRSLWCLQFVLQGVCVCTCVFVCTHTHQKGFQGALHMAVITSAGKVVRTGCLHLIRSLGQFIMAVFSQTMVFNRANKRLGIKGQYIRWWPWLCMQYTGIVSFLWVRAGQAQGMQERVTFCS